MNDNIFLQKLTKEQMCVVEDYNNIVVTAIPGSGKTRVLTNKILYKLKSKNNSKTIIALTYTRVAAEEMKNRIFKQIEFESTDVWIGTIHGFCLDYIIRSHLSYSEFLSKGFTVLNENDTDKIKNEFRSKYGIKQYTKVDFSLDREGKPIDKMNNLLVEEYYKYLLSIRNIDFDYILYETYKILRDNPNLTNNISAGIDSIFVDEYQDTREVQYDIISLIANSKCGNEIQLMFVGDPNQSIYNGIGSECKEVSYLQSLYNREFVKHNLTLCFRSDQKVIDFYKNFAFDKVEMISATDENYSPLCVIDFNTMKDQLFEKITEIINKLLSNGYKENDICIACPQWHFLFGASNQLRKNLPNVLFDAPAIVPIKKDEDSLIYKISIVFLSNISKFNINRMRIKAQEILKHFDLEFQQKITGYDANKIINLTNKIKNENKNIMIGTEFLKKCLFDFFSSLGYIELFKEQIIEFIESTVKRINEYSQYGIEDDKLFFEKSLRSKEGIVLSTIHGIKGEEYRAVIAFGILNGYIPHWDTLFNKPEKKDEYEKKLLFVLASRAKEKVFLFSEQGRFTNAKKEYEPTELIYCLEELYNSYGEF